MFVPVVDKAQNPLMPTTPARAGKWMKSGKATPFWCNGVFCVRLNVDPSGDYKQEIAVGVDPGSKKEGFTVKSKSHTYLNVQADAHNKVAKKVESVVSCGGADVHGNARIGSTGRTVLRTGNGSPLARVRDGGTTCDGWVKNTLVRHIIRRVWSHAYQWF